MGAIISKAANGIGVVLGNAFVAPFKTIFGGSCEDVCLGTWDITCFIEHLCVSNLVKLLMVLGLCYIIMLFLYLLFKVGIIQCIGRSLCKMCWAACETYWFALEDITCFLWHKLKNTKRVNRRRFRDFEEGSSSSEERSLEDYNIAQVIRKRGSVRERRKDRIRMSLNPARRHRSIGRHRSRSHHHVRLRTSEVSVRVKDLDRVRNPGRVRKDVGLFKRRRF